MVDAGELLHAWMFDEKAGGGWCHEGVNVTEHVGGGRSLVMLPTSPCNSPIAVRSGGLVFSLPIASTVSPEMGKRTFLHLGGYEHTDLEFEDESYLAFILAVHSHVLRGGCHAGTITARLPPESFSELALYFNTLPSLHKAKLEFPVFWDLADVDSAWSLRAHQLMCEGACDIEHYPAAMANFVWEAKAHQQAVKDDFETFGKCFPSGVPFDLVDFMFGYSMVTSRSFFVSHWIYTNGGRCYMLPFADLMNHGRPGKAPGCECLQWTYDFSRQALDFRAVRDICNGDELLINYSGTNAGVHPTAQRPRFHFLVFYGFLESFSSQGAAPKSKL